MDEINAIIQSISETTDIDTTWFCDEELIEKSFGITPMRERLIKNLSGLLVELDEYLASITPVLGGYVLLLKDTKSKNIFGMIFSESFASTPINAMTELTRIAHIIYPFFCKKPLDKSKIYTPDHSDIDFEQIDESEEKKLIKKRHLNHENNYTSEQLAISYVRSARVDKIHESYQHLRSVNIDTIVSDSVMDITIKNICILTVLARVAIEENVPVSASFALSDSLIRKSLLQTTVTEASSFTEACLHYYAELIAKYKYQNYPILVQNVLKYIKSHLYEPITLEQIALSCHYSPWYLSRYFKEETGITINEMIHYEKINEAKVLLRFTETPSQEIATSLGYSQQSHFIDRFKRIEGVTPQQYRSQSTKKDIGNLSELVKTL